MWIQKLRAGVTHIAYSLDGRTLYTLDTGGVLTAWDTATHTGSSLTVAYHRHNRGIWGIYLIDDGRLIVRSGGTFTAIDRSLMVGKLPSPPGLEPDQFAHVGSDGRVDYVVRDNVRQILGCHLGNTKAWPVFTLPESLGVLVGVHRFDWSRDRRTLAAILMDGVLGGFDVTPGGDPPRPVRVVSVPNTYRIKLSPDGRTVVALSQYPDRVSLWDVATQTVRIRNVPMSFPGAAVAMNPVYPLFAACQADGTLAIWSLDDGRAVQSLDFALGRAVRCVAFAPDGLTCAVGGTNKQFAVFDVDV